MGVKRDVRALDQALDGWASEFYGGTYKWWWNADYVVSLALLSALRHVRKDGCTYHTEAEIAEMKRLENALKRRMDDDLEAYAEVMELLPKWFSRLWN
ncbi:hypothetical protein [Mycobacterium sp. CnD-18-1]|uniref:hypothetical protein n=1 Tax=Mycobacterium sp. CnD-18-1 TaxID=2917744 RepID=UPI001EF2225E|nr:hypothetical protein [Mycobacterium sp. CnD-18-1]MCG7607164.1 hypothetical protein [Mycobacterium sp. CnD-18-1]